MNTLENWDFLSTELNEKLSQVNRQKSALNLEPDYVDKNEKLAAFPDEGAGPIQTTLQWCTCKDFNFVGDSPRKSFAPCKHIYRLCFELGTMRPAHFDAKMRMKLMNAEHKRRVNTDRLYSYTPDPFQWGGWNKSVHKHYTQIARQFRARRILDLHPEEVRNNQIVSGWTGSLSDCECPDFLDRKLPCKHIYCRAITIGESIPITEERYLPYRFDEGQFLVSYFPTRVTD